MDNIVGIISSSFCSRYLLNNHRGGGVNKFQLIVGISDGL